MKYSDYFKSLPEGSTVSFVDDELKPLAVAVHEHNNIDGSKDVYVALKNIIPKDKKVNYYDTKVLAGFCDLTARWKQLRLYFYHYAITQNYDDRWKKDEGFRKHMLNEYINVDVPITLQLYRLDLTNRMVLFHYIEEELMHGIVSQYILIGPVEEINATL